MALSIGLLNRIWSVSQSNLWTTGGLDAFILQLQFSPTHFHALVLFHWAIGMSTPTLGLWQLAMFYVTFLQFISWFHWGRVSFGTHNISANELSDHAPATPPTTVITRKRNSTKRSSGSRESEDSPTGKPRELESSLNSGDAKDDTGVADN